MSGADVVCAASPTTRRFQDIAATAPPRTAGQRIWFRRTAPARVAASALLRELHAAAALERARNALRTWVRRSLARAAQTERDATRLSVHV